MSDVLDDILGDGGTVTSAPTPVAESATEAPVSTETPVAGPTDADAEAPEPAGHPSGYSKVVAEFSTMEEANTAGYGDLLAAQAFANILTVRNVMATQDPNSVVPVGNIYQGMKAKLHPLPVVLVDGAAYLPQALATEAWDSKPERGTGSTGPATVLTDERLALLTYKATDAVASLTKRLASVQERLTAAQKKAEKYNKLAESRFGADWQAKVDAAGEKSEASKEISDDETPAEASATE